MNAEIGATLVNGYALDRALSVIYSDLRNDIEINTVSSKYVFADISGITPKFNVIDKYPISAFKTFTNVVDANIKDIAIIPAIPYDLKRVGVVTLVDVSTMVLKGVGMIKSVGVSDAEVLWLEYISDSKQLISADAGNLIATGSDGKLYIPKDILEITDNKVYKIDDDIKIVRIYETYLDYDASEIRGIENIHDGCYVIILKDQLHGNDPWLYVLSHTDSISPDISPVREYDKLKEYASVIAVKEYVDSHVGEIRRDFDNDTIVKNPSTDLWQVAIDRHTISKNKDGLYAVDLDVLRKELLSVQSTPGNVAIFNENGYIKDTGYGITSDDETIDGTDKKLVSKRFLQAQYITPDETTTIIDSTNIKKINITQGDVNNG